MSRMIDNPGDQNSNLDCSSRMYLILVNRQRQLRDFPTSLVEPVVLDAGLPAILTAIYQAGHQPHREFAALDVELDVFEIIGNGFKINDNSNQTFHSEVITR